MPHLFQKINLYLFLLAATCFFTGCDNGGSKTPQYFDTPTEGTIHISVDESFKPIIDSQIQVYESQFPKAHIVAEYKSEADCFKDLNTDSTRMIIVTRSVSYAESDYFLKKIKYRPSSGKLAYDAIAVVINKQCKDSLFSIGDIQSMLDGTSGYKYKIVLDGLSATSTVRFAIDSLLKGKPLSPEVKAAKNSQAVMDFVASDANAIGLVGVSWVGKQEDADQLSFGNDKIKVAQLQCELCPTKPYVFPYQGNIALGKYPMIRGIYYVLKENASGLGSGFVNFLIYERGQLIFKRAYLLPARMQFDVRNMTIQQQ